MTLKRGAVAKARPILGVRDLVREDLADLKGPRTQPTVNRFKDPHHRIARMFASGLRHREVFLKSGYSYVRITTLYADPAFQELIAHYRKKVDEGFVEAVEDFYDLATSNMVRAEKHVAQRLDEAEEAGETIPIKDALAISRDAADRFGYGKKQTNVNVNVDFAAQLERAIARSGKQIDATPNENPRVAGPPSTAPRLPQAPQPAGSHLIESEPLAASPPRIDVPSPGVRSHPTIEPLRRRA